MRFLLRNVTSEASFEHRRGKNPGKVTRKPVIGGVALPPGATRALTIAQLTKGLLEEIAEHQDAGNVQLLKVGSGEVNIPELLATISGVVKTVKKIVEVVKEVAPVVKELLQKKDKEVPVPISEQPKDLPELPQDTVIATPDDLAPALPALTDPTDPTYSADDLKRMKSAELQTVLARFGGKIGGKSKEEMRSEILELQAKK